LLGEGFMTILGVDLGTTNSLAVVYKEGKPVLIPNAYGEYVTPSAVSILDGKIVVGKLAKERLITHPECSASLFKRNMGTDVTYALDKKEYDSATLSSFILKQLIEDAQNYLHESIDEVVISVPAYFNARQRQDTKRSGFSASELDSLILVGGSSKMPVLQHYLSDALNIPVLKEENMDSLVALGLGKYIGIKQRDENIKDVVVTDICPFSLSTSTYNEQNPGLELSTVLIPKNSVLPTSKKMTLRTVHKGQTKVNISVFQGQAMYAKENLFLGQAFIHVPRNMHDYESFDLIYSYDINSMLYVEAIVHSTQEHYIFRVSKGDVLEKVDASVRLDSIKEVSLALYQNNEVDALLARIERIYQEVDEETQDYLMRLHSEFTKDMETLINNIQKRKRLINQVSQILNQIEESQNVDSLDIFSQEEDEEGEYLA